MNEFFTKKLNEGSKMMMEQEQIQINIYIYTL